MERLEPQSQAVHRGCPEAAINKWIPTHRRLKKEPPSRSGPCRLRDRPEVGAMVVGALEGALAFEACLFVEPAIKLFLGLIELLAAPAHDDPGGGEHFLEREAGRHPAVQNGG